MTGVSESYSRLLQLAALLFDSKDAMIRVDVFQNIRRNILLRGLSAPQLANSGITPVGQLMEYVRRKLPTIVIIEEIEKALREFVTLWASGGQ